MSLKTNSSDNYGNIIVGNILCSNHSCIINFVKPYTFIYLWYVFIYSY